MSILRSAGSIDLDSAALSKQLHPTDARAQTVPSSRGGSIPIWSQAYVDLDRHRLWINGEQIDPNNAPSETEKADYVFQQIEKKLDSTMLARNAAHLMQQNIDGRVLTKISQKKGISKWPNDEIHESDAPITTHTLSKKKGDRVVRLDADQANFSLTIELLMNQMSMRSPEKDCSFFKVNIKVQGSKAALENGDEGQLTCEAVYTKEVATREEALQLGYRITDETRSSRWQIVAFFALGIIAASAIALSIWANIHLDSLYGSQQLAHYSWCTILLPAAVTALCTAMGKWCSASKFKFFFSMSICRAEG